MVVNEMNKKEIKESMKIMEEKLEELRNKREQWCKELTKKITWY